jgi:hypothetical protein
MTTEHQLYDDVASIVDPGPAGARELEHVLSRYNAPPPHIAPRVRQKVTAIVDGKFDPRPALDAWLGEAGAPADVERFWLDWSEDA